MNLATGCASLDAVLAGGVEPGVLTLVYGEAGVGKTNLALQLARNAVLSEAGKVAYVDTEGVSFDRLGQIAGKLSPKVLKGILFYKPNALAEQVKMVHSLDKIKPPSLVVVDSLNMYYRLLLGQGDRAPSKALTQMLGDLHRLARTREVPILLTAQVYTDDDATRPFGGRIMEHIVKTILHIERTGPSRRRLWVRKHRSLPEGICADFVLAQEGLVPPLEPVNVPT